MDSPCLLQLCIEAKVGKEREKEKRKKHTRMHTDTHTRTQARTHAHTRAHTHTHTHARAHTHTHTCMNTCMHTCMHTHIHAHTHTHKHTHALTHIYFHTHTFTCKHIFTQMERVHCWTMRLLWLVEPATRREETCFCLQAKLYSQLSCEQWSKFVKLEMVLKIYWKSPDKACFTFFGIFSN